MNNFAQHQRRGMEQGKSATSVLLSQPDRYQREASVALLSAKSLQESGSALTAPLLRHVGLTMMERSSTAAW